MDEGIHSTIKILGTFDPMEVRNSAACYIGLKLVKTLGLSSVMTGDGGDELFAGYSFFFDLDKAQLDAELAKMWADMSFSSIPLANNLGLDVRLPILDPEFTTFAMNLDSSFKVGKYDGLTFGKFILRQAFESLLSPEIVWRTKAPLEVGTGTTTLPTFFETRIPNFEFALKKERYLKEERVNLRDKEHLHYYEIYRGIIGIPHLRAVDGRKCPECGGNVKENTAYCRICGAYPILNLNHKSEITNHKTGVSWQKL
jgi:asparagine synthase (glutamine-hydrolysing)